MNSRIGLIVNPRARSCRLDPNLEAKLRYTLGDMGPFVVAWDHGHVERTLAGWAADRVDPVAVVGGDGTNLYAITSIIRAYGEERLPRVAFLGGGTVNTTRGGLGLDGKPLDLIEHLIGLARTGSRLATVDCDVMRVDCDAVLPYAAAPQPGSANPGAPPVSSSHRATSLYGFFFGAGFVARFYELYYRAGAPSVATVARLAGSVIGGVALRLPATATLFAPVDSTVRLDGVEFPGPHRIFLAAKMDRIALGLRPTYRAREQIGKFHVLLSNEPMTTYTTQWFRLFQGRAFSGARHIDRLCSRMEVRFADESPFIVDGELFRGREVTVSSGPVLKVVSAQ